MKNNSNLLTIVVVVIVVALITSVLTVSLTGDIIKVGKKQYGTEVYTKAEIDSQFAQLGNLKAKSCDGDGVCEVKSIKSDGNLSVPPYFSMQSAGFSQSNLRFINNDTNTLKASRVTLSSSSLRFDEANRNNSEVTGGEEGSFIGMRDISIYSFNRETLPAIFRRTTLQPGMIILTDNIGLTWYCGLTNVNNSSVMWNCTRTFPF